MERQTHGNASRSCYRPSKADFCVITQRLRTQSPSSTAEVLTTSLDEGEMTLHERQSQNRQEVLQRDQYLLSVRPNRHVAFAAKRAKIKNQGLTKEFETQVNIWKRELKQNCRIVGANERKLQKELVHVRKKGVLRIPSLSKSSSEEDFKRFNKRPSQDCHEELPRLVIKDSSDGRRDYQKRNESEGRQDQEFRNTINLPDIL